MKVYTHHQIFPAIESQRLNLSCNVSCFKSYRPTKVQHRLTVYYIQVDQLMAQMYLFGLQSRHGELHTTDKHSIK